MLTHISIKGFRRLRDISIAMKPLTVLIGANGVGKSTFLDALQLLSVSADGRLSDFISYSGGLSAMISGVDTVGTLEISASLAPQQRRYGFTLVTRGFGYAIQHEFLDSDDISPRENDAKGHETHLSALRDSDSRDIKRALSADFYYARNFNLTGRADQPQQLSPALSPGFSGENLLSSLYNIREHHPDVFEDLLFALTTVFPSFKKLSLPLVANGTVGLQWFENELAGALSAKQVSEGTLRFLWILTALHSPDENAMILIDEPESSVHPELMRIMVEVIRDTALRKQVVVATHSDRLLDFLEPSEVVAMNRDEEGFATLQWADTMDLDHWLRDYTLDDLWQKGLLGGRAW